MKKVTIDIVKSSFDFVLILNDRLSFVDDYHMNFEVLIQTEYNGFVKEYVFDKDGKNNHRFHFSCLFNFIQEHKDEIVSIRLKFDSVVFDK